MGRAPTVSVIVPCRNEEAAIERCLTTLLQGDYPRACLEIVVADGRSTDRTREVTQSVLDVHEGAKVVVVDNPKLTTTAGINLGFRSSLGEVVLLASAHSWYPPDYVTRLVEGLIATGADCVGGTLVTEPAGPGVVSRAIAACLSHPFGVGNSLMRTKQPTEPAETDAVAFGCWRRETLEALGGFDERMEHSQDFDLNSRLRRRGGKILLLPGVSANYIARGSLRQVIRHNLSNGFWVTYPRLISGTRFSLRHYAPLVLVGALLAGLLPWRLPHALGALAAAAYGVTLAGAAADVARRERSVTVGIASLVVVPSIHIPYGIGSLRGVLAGLVRGAARVREGRQEE